MIGMGHNGYPPLLPGQVRRLLRAQTSGRQLLYSQTEQMPLRCGDLRSGDEHQIQPLLPNHLQGLLRAPQGIVIGDGQAEEAPPDGSPENSLHAVLPVGEVGVHMKIESHLIPPRLPLL